MKTRCRKGTRMCAYIKKCVNKSVSKSKTVRCRKGNRKCANKKCYTAYKRK
jgi:hypothetical protein